MDDGDRALGDGLAGQAKALEGLPGGGECFGAANALPRGNAHRQSTPRGNQAVLDRLEIGLAVIQQGPAGGSGRNDQISSQGGGQAEAQRSGGGHRRIQPVADELAQIDDVLPLAGRGQKGLGSLHVQVIGQHVADAAEQLQQHHAQVGVVEIGPAVSQLRDLGQQLPADRFVIFVGISDACAAHGLSGFRRLNESA